MFVALPAERLRVPFHVTDDWVWVSTSLSLHTVAGSPFGALLPPRFRMSVGFLLLRLVTLLALLLRVGELEVLSTGCRRSVPVPVFGSAVRYLSRV